MPVTNALLHYHILKFIIEHGYGPGVNDLSELLHTEADKVRSGLEKLEDGHGVVLHPNSHRIWVIHPFSLAPTNFLVQQKDNEWWGNCAWCSLGIATLVGGDVSITTTLGANDRQVEINIKDGELQDTDYWIHFPVPMEHAWDNVIYTCSTMLLFESKDRIDNWCKKHGISKGDVQPISKFWEFSKDWYGNHLNPDWKKWTTAEAKSLFEKHDLTGKTWQLDPDNQRF